MKTPRITKMQNEIAELQKALQERNRKIASQNVELSKRDATIADLSQQIKTLKAPDEAAA